MKTIINYIISESQVDMDTVKELAIWFENTETLWKKGEAVANSMIKKSKKEEMSLETLEKSSSVDKLATAVFRDYDKQFGLPKLSTATRAELKKSIAKAIWDFYEENK